MRDAADASLLVLIGMPALAILMALFVVALAFRVAPARTPLIAVVLVGVMALEVGLAHSGLLARSVTPPPVLMLMIPITMATVIFARSRLAWAIADNASYALLIGAQSFRLPLELLMHQAAAERIMPPQLTFTGFNFDIVTGVSAVLIGWLAFTGRAPRWLLLCWSVIGSLLLISVVALAGASMPAIQAFGPDRLNSWVNHAPFVLLPGFLVQTALFLHILVWRKLANPAGESR